MREIIVTSNDSRTHATKALNHMFDRSALRRPSRVRAAFRCVTQSATRLQSQLKFQRLPTRLRCIFQHPRTSTVDVEGSAQVPYNTCLYFPQEYICVCVCSSESPDIKIDRQYTYMFRRYFSAICISLARITLRSYRSHSFFPPRHKHYHTSSIEKSRLSRRELRIPLYYCAVSASRLYKTKRSSS